MNKGEEKKRNSDQEYRIREANSGDAAAMAELRIKAGAVSSLDATQNRFSQELSKANTNDWHLWIAESNSKLIGYGRVTRLHSSNKDDLYSRWIYGTQEALPEGWYLRGVVVSPEFRRKGIAKALTQTRLSWLADKTSTVRCFLDSEEKETGPMYEAMGFKKLREISFASSEDVGILLVLKGRIAK